MIRKPKSEEKIFLREIYQEKIEKLEGNLSEKYNFWQIKDDSIY